MATNKLKVKIIDLAKKNTVFRICGRKVSYFLKYIRFKIRGFGKKVDNHTILFFAFKGKSYACSPKAIYEYMLKDPKYQNYQFIWAFKKPEEHHQLAKNKNTKVIKYGGKEYEKHLAIAKYWIFNYRVADHIYPKKNQVYVQCWHGTPLKKLGYDLKNTHNAMNSQKEIYDRYKIDAKKFKYILSPNQTNKVVEKGYPRNDFLSNYTQEDVKRVKRKLNLPEDKKVILYAPTFRDDQHKSGVGYTYQTVVDFDLLKQNLEKEYVILFRAHYLVANSFQFENYKDFLYDVSNYDDINELYIISDLLITDYSSVFFDYANLKRPIIFYMYDFDLYKDELRGFYIDISELPGEIAKTQTELLKKVENVKDFVYDNKYQEFYQKYNYLEDGNAAKRVVEVIIQ